MTTPRLAKDKIILPLDVPDEESALRHVRELDGVISFFKVGLELFVRSGPEVIAKIKGVAPEARIFLDLKLHDIPNTVAGAVRSARAFGVDLLTVHLSGGGAMLRAAVGEAQSKLFLLGVSVLTSSDEETLRETGVVSGVTDQVLRLAALGQSSGLRGVVASPHEIAALKSRFGLDFVVVAPGVRPASSNDSPDDQRRVMTPRKALDAGADYLVIGRPITAQPDPRAAAERIVREMTEPA